MEFTGGLGVDHVVEVGGAGMHSALCMAVASVALALAVQVFKREYWQYYVVPSEGSKKGQWLEFDFIVVSVDSAYTEKEENDPTGCTTWGIWTDPAEFLLLPPTSLQKTFCICELPYIWAAKNMRALFHQTQRDAEGDAKRGQTEDGSHV
jgi:hypothetical protein